MANDYVITTNESGDLAVRTVSATEASNITDTLSVITRTDDGKLAVRTVGGSGGGGDQHNLGYYATQAALEEAHPTAEAGDWAIVGETDTVWVWDTDNSEWTDSGAKAPTYTAGNGINIDANNEISVTNPVLVNQTTETSGGTGKPLYILNVGKGIGLNLQDTESCIVGSTNNHPGNYGTSFGLKSGAQSGTATHGVMIGYSQTVTAAGAIQIGGYAANNSGANTFKVANANGNFEIMSADGTVPTARLTKVNTTATLAVADWSSSTQTVTVSGVKADSVVFVSPDPASASDYASAGILCTAQAADSLTFTATTTPSSAISVNIVCL